MRVRLVMGSPRHGDRRPARHHADADLDERRLTAAEHAPTIANLHL